MTDHITGELDKLTTREKYNGNDRVHVTNGVDVTISHVGNIVISTPSHNLHLNNVLHIPKATKSLISIHHLFGQGSGNEEGNSSW